MKTEYIQKILEAYYNGTATEEEEKLLFDYFTYDNTYDELSADKEYFSRLSQLKELPVPDTLDEELSEWFKMLDNNKTCKKPKIIAFYKYAARAASILLLFSVGYFYMEQSKYGTNGKKLHSTDIMNHKMINGTIADTEMADLQEMARALEMVSFELNSGLSDLGQVEVALNATVEILNNEKIKI